LCGWPVQTHDRVSQTAMRVFEDGFIDTVTDLRHEGVTIPQVGATPRTTPGRSAGGKTLTKTGDGTPAPAGEQADDAGSTFRVEQGTLVMETDPAAGTGLPEPAGLPIVAAALLIMSRARQR